MSASALAKKLKVSDQAISAQKKQGSFSPSFVEKLKAKGIDIDEIRKTFVSKKGPLKIFTSKESKTAIRISIPFMTR